MAIREIVRKNEIVLQACFNFQGYQYSKICCAKKEAKEWEQEEKRLSNSSWPGARRWSRQVTLDG